MELTVNLSKPYRTVFSPPLEMRSAAVVHRPVLGSTAAISPSLPRSSKFRAKTLPAAKFGGKSIRAHSASASASASSSPSTASLTSSKLSSAFLYQHVCIYRRALSVYPVDCSLWRVLITDENHCRGSYMLGRRALLYMATLSFLPCNDFDKRVCAGAAE